MTDPTDTYRDALAAVLEALDLPRPATVGDEKVYERILGDRVLHARVALEFILERPEALGCSVAYLREQIAKTPAAGYKTWDQVRAEQVQR